jgi:acyl-CoA reductase-like NAD-dependent aldehyde dehydrogenase
LIDGPVNVPLILVFEVVAAALVAGACVAGAVVAPAAAELLVGFALFVAVALVVALAEDDDEADALDVAPVPAIGAPAMFIALVVPN